MKKIWYLLKCPEGREAEYVEKCQKLTEPDNLQEVVCFQYQRMLRYGGSWHLENRKLLPGYIFLSQSKTVKLKGVKEDTSDDSKIKSSVIPCKVSCLKELCSESNIINISRGIIRNGILIVTHGPLKGREHLIRKIDRHKRTVEIEIQLAGQTERIIIGLEVYEKQK